MHKSEEKFTLLTLIALSRFVKNSTYPKTSPFLRRRRFLNYLMSLELLGLAVEQAVIDVAAAAAVVVFKNTSTVPSETKYIDLS